MFCLLLGVLFSLQPLWGFDAAVGWVALATSRCAHCPLIAVRQVQCFNFKESPEKQRCGGNIFILGIPCKPVYMKS